MKNMVYCVCSRGWNDATGSWAQCIGTWTNWASEHYSMSVVMGLPVIQAMQENYERTKEPILAYIQDDVNIYEKDWDKRILKEFEDEHVGLVGMGGALGHGRPELYQVPYHLPNLARQDFLSNMRSWQKHGKRFTGERDVAVIDGFAGFVRRSVLDNWCVMPPIGSKIRFGFPRNVPVGYYMVWENLCCEVRRQGYKIRLVGIDCDHIGGRTSAMHGVVTDDYEAEHRYFFEHNRDMIPYRVPE